MLDLIIIIIVSYLLGSFPSALMVSKVFKGIDIRKHGSGNMGATNSFRVLGPVAGIIVTLLDFLKGYVATAFVAKITIFSDPLLPGDWLFIITSLIVVIGHIFPVFVHFKGGKGFASAAGAITGVYPVLAPFCLLIFLIVLVITGYVAVCTVITSFSLPFIYLAVSRWLEWIRYSPTIFLFFIFTFLLVFIIIRKKFFLYFRGEAEIFQKVLIFKKKKGQA